jgi:4-alpha-glucanotransferase
MLSDADKKLVCNYLACTDKNFLEFFIRAALGTVSWLCLIPMQDVLGLGTEHRMNTPGTMWGNWQWRMRESMPVKAKMKKMAEWTVVYGRGRAEGKPKRKTEKI